MRNFMSCLTHNNDVLFVDSFSLKTLRKFSHQGHELQNGEKLVTWGSPGFYNVNLANRANWVFDNH